MASSSFDQTLKQVHRLFQVGAVGGLSDSQLLDQFILRRDETSEAAFEELVIRHGPMVFRVCRGVLGDSHDADDAFQAVFLVLASRAASIRRTASVASWLFGVAQRVATRARRSASRQRKLARDVMEHASDRPFHNQDDRSWEILHQEIDHLPERLRAPIVLCYLEERSYAAAAHQLRVSESVIRGRLARARDRLRHRLTRLGVTVPAALMTAGAAGQAQAAIRATLTYSTTRIALGFAAGNTAAALARGIMNSMIFNQVKIAAILLCLGIGGSYWAWQGLASASTHGRLQAEKSAKAPARVPEQVAKSQASKPSITYRLTGSVRLQDTGEPVKGGQFTVLLGDSGARDLRSVSSGEDGQFAVDLPPGLARAWTFFPPVGFWSPGNANSQETFVLTAEHPSHVKEYLVRRGVIWTFQVVRGVKHEPVRAASLGASNQRELFMAESDQAGGARLTLPPDGQKLTIGASPHAASLQGISVVIEWATQFSPDAVKSMINRDGRFHLTDDAGRTATIVESDAVHPTIVDQKLVLRVTLPEADSKSFGSLTGRVVDGQNQPLAGAKVALAFGSKGGSAMSGDPAHQVTTNDRGEFVIGSIPRQGIGSEPMKAFVVVTKDGYAGVDSQSITLPSNDGDKLPALEPLRLEPGMSVSGTVVDPEGRPAVGVWVEVRGGYALRQQFTRTDEKGHFRVNNLPKGVVSLYFEFGKLFQMGKYFAEADPKANTIEVRLRSFDEALAASKNRPARRAPSLELGKPAPDWKVAAWTDGKTRSLADYRGKVVLLDFWGIWCSACINGMPSMERLKQKFEPRDVVFLSIHTRGEEIGKIRRFLEFKKASMISALDADDGQHTNEYNGVTADRYEVQGYPTLAIIDRQGNLAFHSGIGNKEGVAAMKALGKEMGLSESTMTEADFHRLWEAYFSREIEKILDRR